MSRHKLVRIARARLPVQPNSCGNGSQVNSRMNHWRMTISPRRHARRGERDPCGRAAQVDGGGSPAEPPCGRRLQTASCVVLCPRDLVLGELGKGGVARRRHVRAAKPNTTEPPSRCLTGRLQGVIPKGVSGTPCAGRELLSSTCRNGRAIGASRPNRHSTRRADRSSRQKALRAAEEEPMGRGCSRRPCRQAVRQSSSQSILRTRALPRRTVACH